MGKKIIGFDVDLRPLKDPYGIPIKEVPQDSFQMRHDGILLEGKLHFWESILSVKISPIFEEPEELKG